MTGASRVTVLLTSERLDVNEAVAAVADPTCGGIDVFAGVVRDHHDGDAVASLEYEAWDEQAVPALDRVAADVLQRFPAVRAVYLAHRVGALSIGDISVVVAASAPHRAEAFAATRGLIDELKSRVPIWKREQLADGSSRWVGTDDVVITTAADERT